MVRKNAAPRVKGGGEPPMISVPKADYDTLLARIEDLEAQLAHARSRDEESFPADVARRLAAGEHPIRVFREHRGRSLRALAREASISPSYLSEIETGGKEGTPSTLRRIADALDLDLDDIV